MATGDKKAVNFSEVDQTSEEAVAELYRRLGLADENERRRIAQMGPKQPARAPGRYSVRITGCDE